MKKRIFFFAILLTISIGCAAPTETPYDLCERFCVEKGMYGGFVVRGNACFCKKD